MSPSASLAAPSAGVRAFVALEPGPQARETVRALQARLQAAAPADTVRWSRPEQSHLTLRFLGEVAAGQIPALIQALEEAVRRHAAFRLELAQLGAFPTLAAPRVLWVGLAGALQALNALVGSVAAASDPFTTHREDREFHPHLTLGRVNRRDPHLLQSLARLLAAAPAPPPCPWTVASVMLYRSELFPAGPVYHVLATVPLAPHP